MNDSHGQPVKFQSPFREPVRVLMHLNGGYTRVALTRTGHHWDIQTLGIPARLRPIGAEFLIVTPRFQVEEGDVPDAVRAIRDDFQVCALTGGDEFTGRE